MSNLNRHFFRGHARVHGFSLVELMVSIVIGLLAVLFATRIMTDSERSKNTALGSSDSMQNGMLAMFSISGDTEQAGFGLNDTLLIGCNTVFSDKSGFELLPSATNAGVFPLVPAQIEAGVNGASDRLTLYAGSAPGGTPILRLTANYIGGTDIVVDRLPFGFYRDDVIVVAPEPVKAGQKAPVGYDKRCAVAQVSQAPGTAQKITIGGDSSFRFNRGELGVSYFADLTRVFNLGPASKLNFHTWSVDGGNLRLRATNLGGAEKESKLVADNIVAFKAQYGFDMRSESEFDAAPDAQVQRWSSTMLDADGVDGVASPGDFGRIVALRLALVARSKHPERPAADGSCSATTKAEPVFSTRQPSNVEPVPMSVNLAVPGDTVDWKCYRYRVFETIVPLRNNEWRSS